MKMNKRTKNARKQISDIHLNVAELSDFLSELQFQAEREFVNQEDSHELADEYIILFQGITKAIKQCRQIMGELELLKKTSYEKSRKKKKKIIFHIGERKGNFNKVPQGCIFQSLSILVCRPLIRVKFYIVNEYLSDDSDEFICTVAEGRA